MVDREAAADARFRRGAGKIERSRPQWRPGKRVADVVVQRVDERQAWEAAQRDLAAERAWEDKMQRQEWRELYERQEREEPGAPDIEERHTRERVELGRDHARVARELHEEAAAKYKAAVEAPIRSDQLSPPGHHRGAGPDGGGDVPRGPGQLPPAATAAGSWRDDQHRSRPRSRRAGAVIPLDSPPPCASHVVRVGPVFVGHVRKRPDVEAVTPPSTPARGHRQGDRPGPRHRDRGPSAGARPEK